MQSIDKPTLMPVPFAANGQRNDIPQASQISITKGAASLNDGFPPLTMTNPLQGGIPPFGKDMNGILNLISRTVWWKQAGGSFVYNAAFANDPNVGGYPAGAMLLRADLSGFWFNVADNNQTDPDATDGSALNWISVNPDWKATRGPGQILNKPQVLNSIITPQDFGAVGDGKADDTSSVRKAYAAALAQGVELMLTAWYRCTAPIVFDLASAPVAGVKISGIGRQNCGLIFDANVPSPNLLIESSSVADVFYPDFVGWGVKGNVPGVVLQVGKEDFSDLINEATFDLVVNNGSTASVACAVEMNAVFNADARFVANCGGVGAGDALRLRRVQFSLFRGSYGNANISQHLTGDYTYGNTFLALDNEMVNECVVMDEANVANNTWVGGQFEWSSGGAAINATAGNNNRVVGANFASAGEIAINSIGVVIYGSRGATGTETLGGLNVSPLAGDGAVSIDSVMAHAAEVLFKQAGVARWGIVRDTSANLLFNRYNAAGALLGTAAWFEPTAGVFNIGALSAAGVGFFGSGVSTTRPIVTGSRGGNTALASMLSAMATLGLITDNTTP